VERLDEGEVSTSVHDVVVLSDSEVREVREVMRLVHSTDFNRLDAVGNAAAVDPAIGRFENEWTVAALLTTLPPAERETVRLRFELGLSQTDIAARCGVSQMSICRGLQNSLGRLRSRLSLGVAEVTS
jgi:RNA polymerase sigma factor (sigma-70 family)